MRRNRDVEGQVKRVQFGASLKINHAVSGSQPKHFIFPAGQLCRHKLGLASGFLQIGKLSLDALAAEIVDERELRIRSTVDTDFDRINLYGDISVFDFYGLLETEFDFISEIVSNSQLFSKQPMFIWWRRRELNPRPKSTCQPRLHAYPK